MNEADTCRTLVRPRLEAAGWDGDRHFYNEQTYFTDGRIVVPAGKPRVTSDEGDIGRGFLSKFQDPKERAPVILTTSQLLTSVISRSMATIRISPGQARSCFPRSPLTPVEAELWSFIMTARPSEENCSSATRLQFHTGWTSLLDLAPSWGALRTSFGLDSIIGCPSSGDSAFSRAPTEMMRSSERCFFPVRL